jgi:hypothetical protein
MPKQSKINRPDTPLAPTPSPKETGGTYIASSSGRVGRTYPIYKEAVEYQSMDTTGYSKGKSNFELKTSGTAGTNIKPVSVSRKDVPAVISKLKEGATRKVDYRTASQKKK